MFAKDLLREVKTFPMSRLKVSLADLSAVKSPPLLVNVNVE